MTTAAVGPSPVLTVGHGTASQAELTDLLSAAGVGLLVDIRRFPASRKHPHVAREALAESLPQSGIAYRWEERLGGRRHLSKDSPQLDPWWTVAAFRAYAAYTRSADFQDAMTGVLSDARAGQVAVMCSESVWWRCHRRLVADVAVLSHGMDVCHLMHDGRQHPHPPAPGARLAEDGLLFWDAG